MCVARNARQDLKIATAFLFYFRGIVSPAHRLLSPSWGIRNFLRFAKAAKEKSRLGCLPSKSHAADHQPADGSL
jgi:hypothetical protein